MLAFFIATRYTMTCVEMTQAQAPLAQLAEHLTLNQGVQGSNPWRRISKRFHINVLAIIAGTYFFFFQLFDEDVIVEK